MKKYKILFALIDNRSELLKSFVASLIGMYDYTKQYHQVNIMNIDGNFIDQMRNVAVETAINGKYDYIFFIDTDMIYPKDAVIKLLSDKKDIVGGLYFKRKYPHGECHFKQISDINNKKAIETFPEGTIKRVKATGFGGVLVKTKVFKNMKFPYFKVRYSRRNGKLTMIGEDIDFCMKAGKKYGIWIDPKVKYGHIGLMAVYGNKDMRELL